MTPGQAASRAPTLPTGAVLVTGAAGFIGSHVVEAFVRSGRRVVGLDNLDPYYDLAQKRGNLDVLSRLADFRFVQGDIRDAGLVEEILTGGTFAAVVHLAALAGVRPSIERPAEYMDVNVRGTTVLLEQARRAGVRPFVMASSSSVYGARTDPPFREDDPAAPARSPYAASKQAAERVGQMYAVLHGMDVVALRFFNAFGPRQRPDMAIHKFSRRILAGEPIPFYGDGSSRRDHTYIDDIVDGVVRSTERAPGIGYRVYNLGNNRTVSLTELVQALETLWGRAAVLERLPDQPGDVPLTCAEVTRPSAELGFRPSTDLASGLARFADWFREVQAP